MRRLPFPGRTRLLIAVGCFVLAIAPTAGGAVDLPEGEGETFALILADDQTLFADDLGDGSGFGAGDETVGDRRIQTIKFTAYSRTIRSHEEHRWGYRARLPFSIGIDRVTFDDIVGEEPLDVKLHAWAFVPRLELSHQIDPVWLVKPFLELGIARETSGLEEWFVVGGAGVSFEREQSWGPRDWLWESQLKYGADQSLDGDRSESYTSVQTGAGIHFPTGLEWRDARWTFGTYGSVRYYLNELVLPLPGTDELPVDLLYEVGVSFGAFERAKLWGITIPRLRVGYRWGDNVKGFKIRLGGSF